MIFEIVIPNLGATGSDVVLEQWLVGPGDFVKIGQPIFVITTDKATVEVEVFRDGYVHKLLASPGAKLSVGAVVATIADTKAKTILASPLARRMAREAGLPLESLAGSGREGQILRKDVQKAIETKEKVEVSFFPDFTSTKVARAPVSAMRRAIEQRTKLSKTDIPHFYATITVDVTEAKGLLIKTKAYAEKNSWPAPTLTDLIVRAAALALLKTPQLNASFQGEEILYFEDIHIGLVIGLEDGLIIPVIRNADKKNLFTLAGLNQRLKDGANSGVLTSKELTGSTFTISNLGMYGLDSFTAIIVPPQAGVLAIGAARQVAAVLEDEILPRWQLIASLSVDHRLVDGVIAAKFLAEFKLLLEDPISLTFDTPDLETE